MTKCLKEKAVTVRGCVAICQYVLLYTKVDIRNLDVYICFSFCI